jgi:preprotein translocase subunit SecE
MARLQRKKTSSKKKKRKPSGEREQTVIQGGGVIEKKTPMPVSMDREIKKRQTAVQQKTTSIAKISPGKEKNFAQKGIQFLREVRVELKKVTWPSRKQTIGSTVVVIILVLIVSLFLGVVDVGLSSLVRVVLQ